MSDHPITFPAPMVRALLDRRKTQARRVLNVSPDDDPNTWISAGFSIARWAPGSRLWVREAFAVHHLAMERIYPKGEGHPWGSPIYKATFSAMLDPRCEGFTGWRSPITMPRWASRITLIVEDVRVERLQDISEADARAEGIRRNPHGSGDQWMDYPEGSSASGWRSPRDSYRTIWNATNPNHPWESNPWVSVTTFRREKP